jgi:hypothetical protein
MTLALVGGSGRCGTASVAAFLDGLPTGDGAPLSARHETAQRELVDLCLSGGADAIDALLRDFRHDVEVSPLVPFYPWRLPHDVLLLAVVRDARRVVPSGMDVGWGTQPGGEDGQWVGIQRFEGATRFERCCRQWVWTNGRLIEQGARFWRLEELIRREDARRDFAAALGADASSAPFPWMNDRRAQTGGRPRFPEHAFWSSRQRRAFDRICGALMDELYYGWRAA